MKTSIHISSATRHCAFTHAREDKRSTPQRDKRNHTFRDRNLATQRERRAKEDEEKKKRDAKCLSKRLQNVCTVSGVTEVDHEEGTIDDTIGKE